MKIYMVLAENKVEVFSTRCNYYDGRAYLGAGRAYGGGAEGQRASIYSPKGPKHIIKKEYRPEGGFEEDTTYECHFWKDGMESGLTWRFRTEKYNLNDFIAQDEKLELFRDLDIL